MTVPSRLLFRFVRGMMMEPVAPKMHPAHCMISEERDMCQLPTEVQDYVDGIKISTARYPKREGMEEARLLPSLQGNVG